jgi:hypothetical protein
LDNTKKSVAIDFSKNPKNSSLYFEHLLPYGTDFDVDDDQYVSILKELLPKSIELVRDSNNDICMVLGVSDGSKEVLKMLVNVNIIKNYTFESSAEIRPTISFFRGCTIVYPSAINPFSNQSYDTTTLKLLNLDLIDTSKADWEQIIEIRKDKNSINKLRKLKTFFHENYTGKEKNFIQDDLLNRIEDYKNVTKDWGFETLVSSITLMKTSLTTVGSSLVMALTGQPLEVAAATGIFVGIGNISLQFAKEKHKLMKLGRDHPLAYIIDSKKCLEK